MIANFLKKSWAVLILVGVVLPLHKPAFAGPLDGCKRGAAEQAPLRVSGDFDGDSKTDTAVAKFCGSSYRIDIVLSSKRSRIRLTVPVRHEVGLELIAYDVNHDNRIDLVLTGASRVKPIAVWLNMGNGSFERSSGLLGPFFGTDSSPRLLRGIVRSDVQALIPTDDPADEFTLETPPAFQLERGLTGYGEQSSPTASAWGSASPRGPPTIHL
jgi:hypothetical protein